MTAELRYPGPILSFEPESKPRQGFMIGQTTLPGQRLFLRPNYAPLRKIRPFRSYFFERRIISAYCIDFESLYKGCGIPAE